MVLEEQRATAPAATPAAASATPTPDRKETVVGREACVRELQGGGSDDEDDVAQADGDGVGDGDPRLDDAREQQALYVRAFLVRGGKDTPSAHNGRDLSLVGDGRACDIPSSFFNCALVVGDPGFERGP